MEQKKNRWKIFKLDIIRKYFLILRYVTQADIQSLTLNLQYLNTSQWGYDYAFIRGFSCSQNESRTPLLFDNWAKNEFQRKGGKNIVQSVWLLSTISRKSIYAKVTLPEKWKLLTAGHELKQIKSKNAITSAYSHILEQA